MGIGTVIELVTGTLISFGLFTRVVAFIASGEMAVGYWLFHAPASLYRAANCGDAAILSASQRRPDATRAPDPWALWRAGRRPLWAFPPRLPFIDRPISS